MELDQDFNNSDRKGCILNGMQTIPLRSFLEEWGDALGQKVIDQISPVHNPLAPVGVEKYEAKIDSILRPLFPSQAEVAKALARGFYDIGKDALILVGEMGTGKTTLGATTAYLNSEFQRTIVMCPPHLVNKWQREIKAVVPDAIVEDLNGKDVISKLIFLKEHRYGTVPQRHEFYVISRERAKNSYFWETAVNKRRLSPLYYRCPDCGGKLYETTEDGVFPLSIDALEKKKLFCDNTVAYRVLKKGEGDKKDIKYRKVPLSYMSEEGDELEELKCRGALWTASPKLRRFAPVDFIKNHLPDFFDMGIFDECHEFKAGESNQGIAFGVLVSCVKKSLLLTGTLMGGYADDLFPLLFRIGAKSIKDDGFNYGEDQKWMKRYGVLEEVKYIEEADKRSGKGKKKNTIVKRRPGMSPEVLAKHLLDKAVFIRLADVAEGLPSYEEQVITLDLEGEMGEAYRDFEKQLTDAIRKYRGKPPMALVSKMLQALLAYPDTCMIREEEVWVYDKKIGEEILVATAPKLDDSITTPKEADIIEFVTAEHKAGRKVLVYCTFTDTRDVTKRVEEKLKKAGFRTAILKSCVPPLEREEWVAERVKDGIDVILCNPELVKTGLDFYDFPSIAFYQTGYVIPTLRQASRRSWRIGQTRPVKVLFFTYGQTMQAEALRLIATKLETALMTEGELTDGGLAALSTIGTTLMEDMAKSLATGMKGSAEEAWAKFRKKEVQAELGLAGNEKTVAPKVVEKAKVSRVGKTTVEVEQLAADKTIKVEIIEYDRPRKKRISKLEVTAQDLNAVLLIKKGSVQFSMF